MTTCPSHRESLPTDIYWTKRPHRQFHNSPHLPRVACAAGPSTARTPYPTSPSYTRCGLVCLRSFFPVLGCGQDGKCSSYLQLWMLAGRICCSSAWCCAQETTTTMSLKVYGATKRCVCVWCLRSDVQLYYPVGGTNLSHIGGVYVAAALGAYMLFYSSTA